MIAEIREVLDELGTDPSTLAAEVVRLRRRLDDALFDLSAVHARAPLAAPGPVTTPRRRIGYLP